MDNLEFDLESDINVSFYNKDNYDDFASASEDGADYHTASRISLYRLSGLHDLLDLSSTISRCSGAGNYVPVVQATNGKFYDVEDVIGLLDV